jgi:hypothetical protein
MKKYLILFIISLSFLSTQTKDVEAVELRLTVLENLDLYVDGSTPNGVWVNVTEDFDHIDRFVFIMDFVDQVLDFDDFAGDSALTNGIQIFYNNIQVNSNITKNEELGRLGRLSLLSDEQNPKGRTFTSEIIIDMLITSTISVAFRVNDNMTDLTTLTTIEIEVFGHRDEVISYFSAKNNFEIYSGATSFIFLEDLDINRETQLKLSTTIEEKWINFTTTERDVKIVFAFDVSTSEDKTQIITAQLYQADISLENRSFIFKNTIVEISDSGINTGVIVLIGVTTIGIVTIILGVIFGNKRR